ncbi:hypothetical protein QE152_g26221 [Popillia japonica]|uniref:Uncharacterized protein n=1 Tax=Popillia japonica TaxID=7064 RepID=A0AAW1JYD6_POPJA
MRTREELEALKQERIPIGYGETKEGEDSGKYTLFLNTPGGMVPGRSSKRRGNRTESAYLNDSTTRPHRGLPPTVVVLVNAAVAVDAATASYSKPGM